MSLQTLASIKNQARRSILPSSQGMVICHAASEKNAKQFPKINARLSCIIHTLSSLYIISRSQFRYSLVPWSQRSQLLAPGSWLLLPIYHYFIFCKSSAKRIFAINPPQTRQDGNSIYLALAAFEQNSQLRLKI